MEIKCKVHEIGQEEQVTDTFKRRALIVEYAENPSYPEYIKFEALQDKTSLLDKLKVGDNIEVFFNLRGRPWTDKNGKTTYFNSLVIWKIAGVQAGSDDNYATPTVLPEDDDSSELPF